MATLFIGNIPKSMNVDHIDRNQKNNSVDNLRIVTASQNRMNACGKKSGTTSVYKGVYYCPKRGLWVSQIKLNKKITFLGRYKTEIEAAEAYDDKCIELHGEYATTNKSLGLLGRPSPDFRPEE